MNKHYAIFDMDGTLVDSMGYWHSMEREFLLNKGIREGLDEILEATKPMTLTESCAYFSSFCGIDFITFSPSAFFLFRPLDKPTAMIAIGIAASNT